MNLGILKLDGHVHLLGDGSSGSGCELRLHTYQRALASIMVRQLGIPPSALRGGLDAAYLQRLRELVYFSSLDGAVLLANDYTRDESGRPIENFGSMYTPNDYLIKVCTDEPCFLPGISVHPARPDAIDELHRLSEAGAVVLKLLPNCHNVDCRREQYIPFWETVARLGIVFLAHTGGELSLPVYDARFADPSFLDCPLECGVTVIAAHCGTSSHLFDPNYMEVFCAMLERYPRLYGDNSGMMTPIRVRHMLTLRLPRYRDRILHGSDMPIPVSARWAYLWGLISRAQFKECDREKNFLERDVLLKRTLGFSDASFYTLGALISDRRPQIRQALTARS